MIGDSLSQDRMCGRYLAYANIPRLCHACNVTPEESEDPSHVCNYLDMQEINQKCILAMTKEQLKQKQQTKQQQLQALSQHMHINAFENVWLGSNTYGLLESLPHDMMHAFLHGSESFQKIQIGCNSGQNYCSNQIHLQSTISKMQLH